MDFSTFFSKQARKPEGLFGRTVMRVIFDQGNALLNDVVNDLMSVQSDDRIIEIGSGTGKLLNRMAKKIDTGHIVSRKKGNLIFQCLVAEKKA